MNFTTVGSGKTISGATSDFVTVTGGGSAVAVTVSAGTLTINNGGRATGTVVNQGYLQIGSGGVASGTVVNSGFSQVYSGGVDSGTVVNSGGYEIVGVGGVATDLVVHSGGFAVISGTIDGVVLDKGTSLNVYPTGSATRLNLAANNAVDLAYLPYISGAALSLDPATDILTISGGGMTQTVQLAGDYTNKAFSTSSDQALLTFMKGTPGTVLRVGAYADGVDGTVTLSGNNNILRLTSGKATVNPGTTGNTVILGYGACTVNDNGGSTIFAGSGAGSVLTGAGSTLVVGSTGNLAVIGGSGAVTAFAGTGGLIFQGGSGYAVVVGQGHMLNVQGGTGGGTYFGGGGGTIRAGGDGAQSILLGTAGDKLITTGSTGSLFGAGDKGSVVMDASASTGSNVFFGATGTGTLTFITGSGNDVLGLGQGTNQVTLGSGHSTVFANTGTTGVSTITMGSGSTDIGLGGRSVDVLIAAGTAARTVSLFNFVPGADRLVLSGFAAGAQQAAIASQSYANGSTSINLGDGTTVTFVGTAGVDATALR